MDADHQARIDRLLDRQDILDCLTRFSRGIDRFDRELFLSAFHPDAVIAAGDFVGGPADLFRWASAMHEQGQVATHHNLLNNSCEVDGDTAHSETYYLFAARNRDETNWIAGGRYFDRLHRRDGQWRIAVRTNVIEWSGMVPTMPLPFADTPDIHGNGAPSRTTADPSYQRPLVNHREKHDPGQALGAYTAAMPDEKYQYGIDFERVAAIDIHTHVEVDGHGNKAYDDELVEAVGKYFKMAPGALSSVDALADEYRRHNTAAVVFTIDAHTGMRHVPNSIEDLVAGAVRNNDVLIPFGSVDPWHERRAVHRVNELVRDYGVKGFKFHPSMQAFEPNDRRFYPIYEAIAEAGVPALFHTGQTGIGAGLPGGHRIKLRYSDPMLLDDVAADFPELTIVMAHPAVPWVDAQISIASHKSNVYIDLSGWSPTYFPPQLVRAFSRQLRTKVLFGTDYPYIKMDRWRRDFEGLDIDPAVVPLIYKDNALRVLGVTV